MIPPSAWSPWEVRASAITMNAISRCLAASAAVALAAGCWRGAGDPAPAAEASEPEPTPEAIAADKAASIAASRDFLAECVADVQRIMEGDEETARREIGGILLEDAWLGRFIDANAHAPARSVEGRMIDDIHAESRHLGMQQFVALRAAAQPERYADILLQYYGGVDGAGDAGDGDDFLRNAAIRLIRQGEIYETVLDDDTGDDPYAPRCEYFAGEPVEDESDPDHLTVRAEFLKQGVDRRAYDIEFRRVETGSDGAAVWLPVSKNPVLMP